MRVPFLIAEAVILLGVLAAALPAHETDQFSVPVGQQFADIGPHISQQMTDYVRVAVRRLNRRIRTVLETDILSLDPGSRPRPGHYHDPNGILPHSYSPHGVAQSVYEAAGPAIGIIEGLEQTLYAKPFTQQYPGQLTAYKAKDRSASIYNEAYLIVDPRNISALFHASTINLYGVYLGTDKLGHFTDMGYHYFKTYLEARHQGKSEQDAMIEAVRNGTDGLFSEKGALGYLTAGSYSNADLVANYLGCLFYRNLTKPIVLKGRLRQPMLVRDGAYWAVSEELDAPDFFQRFVCDHLDEALNPSLYEPAMRSTVKRLVERRSTSLLLWYRDRYVDRDPVAYFTRLTHVLATYYGDPYGHSGQFDDLIHIGNTIESPQTAHAK